MANRNIWGIYSPLPVRGPKSGRLAPKWDKSREFFRSDSVHFGKKKIKKITKCTESDLKSVLNLVWKNPRICPILGKSDPLLGQIWSPRNRVVSLVFSRGSICLFITIKGNNLVFYSKQNIQVKGDNLMEESRRDNSACLCVVVESMITDGDKV